MFEHNYPVGQDFSGSGSWSDEVAVNGNVKIRFLIDPSGYCGAGDHYYTDLYIDSVTVTSNTAPNAPTNPSPSAGATGVSTSPALSVDVSDSDGDSMNVAFYDASDDSVIGSDNGVASGGTASVTWGGLSTGTIYSWYAIADDGSATTQSSTWSFTTNYAPTISSGPSFHNYSTQHGFNASAIGSDSDGQSDLSTCTIFHDDNDGNSYSDIGTLDTSFGNSNEAACNTSTGSKIDDSIAGYEVKESIDVEIQFTDASGAKVNTSIASNPISGCIPPASGDWIIEQDCTVFSDVSPSQNVEIRSSSTMNITKDGALDLDFLNNYLLIKAGSTLLIDALAALY